MSSRKTAQPQSSPQQPGAVGGVDFLVRTMIERESTGKRPIRPKNVEDLLQSTMQDESDDPDFDCGDEDSDSAATAGSSDGSNESENDGGDNDGDSDESDDEDYQEKGDKEGGSSSSDADDSDSEDESSNEDESEGSDSDEPDATKKSALRETLEKLNEADDFMGKRPKKKRRKVMKNRENVKPKKGTAATKKLTKKSIPEPGKAKAGSTKRSSKPGKKTKISKAKRVILSKKSKVASKKIVNEKRRKKKKVKKSEDKDKHRSILNLIDNAVLNQKENRKEMDVSKPICSACLGDKSDDSNEIVECDSCGISVHEVCYGLAADNLSISSGSGSSSCTEPWFCDVCKSGSENIYCELCPIEGGLFKESTAGRWVHLVCAMYTQGVALHHDSSINLYEIHYARWGSHSCAACDDERLAHTGIVISCDAGMCRTYFHATCAQKLGLLSDPNQVDFAEADPYYVSCKLHTNRETMKRRIRLFNTLQEQLRIKKERKESGGLPSVPTGAKNDHARILRKLDKVRQKTALKRAQYLNSLDNVPTQSTATDQVEVANPFSNLPSSWTTGNKKQRLMHTSAKLGKDFLRKTERLGEDIVAHELEVKHEKIVANVKRKWNVMPAMSVEYAAYYSDRENRIRGLMEHYDKSIEENHVLMDKEIGLKDIWETHSVNQEAMAEETQAVSKQLESLASILTSVCPSDKRLATKLQFIIKPKEFAITRRKTPSTSRGDRKSPSPRRSSAAKKALKNRVISPSPSRAGKLAVAVCATCSKSDNQHLITRCDKCKKHYHLSCLDPPLTRMPKRSRLCGWMCSDCCEAPSEVEGQVDTEAPRTLRGRTKIHKPRKYRGSDDSEDEKRSPEADSSKTVSKKSPKLNAGNVNLPEVKPFGDVSPTRSDANTPTSSRVQNTSPMERRRRSGSANMSTVSPSTIISSPVASHLATVNGPVGAPGILSPKDGGKFPFTSVPQPEINSQVDVLPTSSSSSSSKEAKLLKKRKVLTTPKIRKTKLKIAKTTEHNIALIDDAIIKNEVIPSFKRKSSDVPPTTAVKVNGIHDPPLQDDKSLITKQKPRAKKKKKVELSLMSVDQIKNETTSLEGSTAVNPVGKMVVVVKKQKKPRKKKEGTVVANVEGALAGNITTSSAASMNSMGLPVIPAEKVKKVRKKKEKVVKTSVDADADTSLLNPDQSTSLAASPEKKSKKKSNKQPAVAPIFNAAREEKNGVDIEIRKFGSQIVVSKALKNLQNGAVKATKKRKSNNTSASMSPQAAPPSISSNSDEKEKYKSVPPKKRKRVSSSAQQQLHGQPNSVDSIINAVSIGDFNNKTIENGTCALKPVEMSTIMQGVAPINRQLAPEQNIMQGKAMGSGVNSEEMVTFDASFLLDGASSSQSSFGVNSTATTFYSSSNRKNSITVPHDESAATLKLSSSGGSAESGNSENVIRLQYIDAPSVSISDSTAMPPPAPLSTSSNAFSAGSVCATCTKTDSRTNLVACDKCLLEFHFMCLVPPKKSSPRRKGQPWFCSDCDDGDTQPQENGVLPPS